MKVYSELLKAEIELEAFEGCVTYKGLKHFFLYELDKAVYAQRHDISFVPGTQWPVAKCVIDDARGNHIVCFGEANPENIQSDIDKNNPYMCAAKRAFNNAVVEYLGLPGRVGEAETPAEGSDPAVPVATESYLSAPVASQPAAADEMPAAQPEAQASVSAPAEPVGNPWDQVYDSGKYKGSGKTYREVADENSDYVQWIIDKGRNRKDADIFAQYLASKGN